MMDHLSNNGSFELQQHTQKLSLAFVEAQLKHHHDGTVSELADDWLIHNPNDVSISHGCHYIAILKNDFLFIVNNTNRENQVTILVQEACTFDGERVTSFAWLTIPSDSGDSNNRSRRSSNMNVLIVGSSEGYVRMFNEKAELLSEQLFHTAPVLKIKLQSTSHWSCLPDQQIECAIVLYANIVVKIDIRPLSTYLRKIVGPKYSDDTTEARFSFFQKCEIRGQNHTHDVICCNNVESSAFDMFKSKPTFVLVACGACPMIAEYSSDPNADQSISASQIASKYANKVSSAVFSFTKNLMIWGEKKDNNDGENSPSNDGINNFQPLMKSSKNHDLDDRRREMYTIAADVSGRFAVTSDNFGRVMFLELRSLSILKVFKGYRNAQCAFLNIARVSSSKNSLDQRPGLFIIVYAPLRGMLECWNVSTGKRECAMNVGLQKMLVSVPPVFAISASSTTSGFYGTNDVFLMDIHGKLDQIVYYPHTSSMVSVNSGKNFGIFRDSELHTSPVYSADENSIQQFINIALDSSDKDIDKLKMALSTFTSYSHVVKALSSILSLSNITLQSHKELTDHALSILKENYSSNQNSKWESFQTWTQNRIQVLKALSIISTYGTKKQNFGEPDFEMIDELDKEQEWILLTDEKCHKDISHVELEPYPSNDSKMDLDSIIGCFNLYERVVSTNSSGEDSSYFIPLKSLSLDEKRLLGNTFFTRLQDSLLLAKKALSMAHIRPTDLQDLFLFWFMDTSVGRILAIRPSILQKLIYDLYPVSKSVLKSSNLQSSTTMLALATILENAKNTKNILNAILFLSLYKLEVTAKLERTNTELHKRIAHVQEQLSDIQYLKSTLLSPRVKSSDLSISVLMNNEITLSQILAREQVYSDSMKSNFTGFTPEVEQVLKRFPLLHESESEDGIFIDKSTEDRNGLLLFHCVIESAAIENFDLATQYLSNLAPTPDTVDDPMEIPDHIAGGLAVWDAFVQNHFAPLVEWSIQKHKFLTEQELESVTKFSSLESWRRHCEFFKMVLKSVRDFAQKREPEDADSDDRSDASSSYYSESSMSSHTFDDAPVVHWPPYDQMLSEARLQARKRLPDSDTSKQLISLLHLFNVALEYRIGDAVKVNLVSLFSKKKVLLPILKKRLSASNAKTLLMNSISEPLTRQSLLAKARSSKSKRSISTKDYRLDFIRQLVEQDMLNAALLLTAQHECFPSIDADTVYLEALRILFSEHKDEKAHGILLHINTIQSQQTKAKAGKILMDISSKRVADLLHAISLTKGGDNKSVAHLISDMPPKLFTYMTHYMKDTEQSPDVPMPPVDINATRALLEQCVQSLAKTGPQSNDYNISCMMLKFIKKLEV